MDIMVKMW